MGTHKNAGGRLNPHDWLYKRLRTNKTIDDNLSWKVIVPKVEVIWGANGVAMDRHGLILWKNEATGSRKGFRCHLDLRDAIF